MNETEGYRQLAVCSRERRCAARRAEQQRKATRRLLAAPALIGVAVACTAVTYEGMNLGLQAVRVTIACLLVTPWLAFAIGAWLGKG